MTAPIGELSGPIRALFSDVDGTLTTDGQFEPETYSALIALAEQIDVVLVTGRPAGWGHALMTMMPVKAVVSENGGLTFVRGKSGTIKKWYGVAENALPEWRRRMRAAAVDVISEVPGARMASDSIYREVDLAIDWNEEISLDVDEAERMVSLLQKGGFAAVRSSVHVNFGPPEFNKLSACLRVIKHVLQGDENQLDGYVFIGDALNDAPMFGGFPKSVGVANVKRWWDELSAKPAFVTEAPEGAGFRELAAHITKLL